MAINIKGNGKMDSNMARECSNGMVARLTKEAGKIISFMVMESSTTKETRDMKASTTWATERVKASLLSYSTTR